MRISLIGNETYQGKSGEISRGFEAFRKAKQNQQTYEKEFYSNKISEQIEPVYLVVKLKEAKLD